MPLDVFDSQRRLRYRLQALSVLHWFQRDRTQPPRSALPLVLLHGFTGAPASWAPVAQALPPALPAVAVALPGHHPDLPVAPGFEANLDSLAEILLDAGLAGCHLAGYSLGARTALGLAVRQPALASALTLIGGHTGLSDASARTTRQASDQRWAEMLMTGGMAAFIEAWQAHPIFATQAALPAQVQARQHRIRSQHEPAALAQSLIHMGLGAMPDYGPALATLTMPVTWITGARDDKFTALAEAAEARMRAAGQTPTRRVITGSGHNPALEAPTALAALLTAAHPPARPS